MALLALRPGHHRLLHAPPAQSRLRRCGQRLVVSCGAAQVSSGAAAALVWFKHDLRVDDHPGLVAACAERRRPVVPLYVFDRRILAGYSDTMLELLLFALKDLKSTLKLQQSDLLIALGNAEDVVLKLANEWSWLLASKSQLCIEGKYPLKFWRWKGYLIQYTSVGDEGPAVLLVHGFGASLQHFRDNISNIADGGHRVWAITLLGFGRSEKPNVDYSELLWSELLRDFIVDVVSEPVHLVGNSIGGYICAIAAGLWPSLANSLVLLNSAGSVVPSYSFIPLSKEGRSSWLSRLQARLILLFLRSRAGGILKKYYPTRTERVDKPLVDEIIRASYDPGATTVIESIFNFNLSIPLNFLFDSFGGNILVIQGMKDPLTKSESFVSMLREHCSKVQIRELNAGHAPHDEVPDQVNSLLSEWMKVKETELKPALEKSKAI
uniref:Uncharacterized protein n=3 Tax=Avena sativa TaxID=4498 RepID=A0ACD5XUW6_AVESA